MCSELLTLQAPQSSFSVQLLAPCSEVISFGSINELLDCYYGMAASLASLSAITGRIEPTLCMREGVAPLAIGFFVSRGRRTKCFLAGQLSVNMVNSQLLCLVELGFLCFTFLHYGLP